MNNINNFQNNRFSGQSIIRRPKEMLDDEVVTPEAETETPTNTASNRLNIISEVTGDRASLTSALDQIAAHNLTTIVRTPGPSPTKIAELKSMGITVDTTDASIINGIIVSKDASTGEITLSGLKGTTSNVIKVTVDDSVKNLKLDAPENVALSANSKTKLNSSGSIQNLIIDPRFDLDVDYTNTMIKVAPCGSSASSSGCRYFVLNYDSKTGAGGIGGTNEGTVQKNNPGFTGFDQTLETNKRISQLEALGVTLSDTDKVALSTSAWGGATLIDRVTIAKDATTGKVAVTSNAYETSAKTEVEKILAKTTSANDAQAKIALLKDMGITVNTTDSNIINGITVSKNATTGEITLGGLKGTTSNIIKVTVDDSVKNLKLDAPENTALSVNSKTKLNSSGSIQNLIIDPRFDLDVDYTNTMIKVAPCGSSASSSGCRYFVLNYDSKTGAGGIGGTNEGTVQKNNPGFTGFDQTLETNKRISQLESLGVTLSDADKVALSTSAWGGATLIDRVTIAKDATTGKVAVTSNEYETSAKTEVEKILAKTTNEAKIADAQKAVDDAKMKADLAAKAATAAGIASAKAQEAIRLAQTDAETAATVAKEADAAKVRADAALAEAKAASATNVQSATSAVTSATKTLASAKASLLKAKGFLARMMAQFAISRAQTALNTANTKLTAAKVAGALNISKAQTTATTASTTASTKDMAASTAANAATNAQITAATAKAEAATTSTAATEAANALVKAQADLAALKA